LTENQNTKQTLITEGTNEITSKGLTLVLKSSKTIKNTEVLDVVSRELIGNGRGATIQVFRLIPTYSDNEKNAPASIICKISLPKSKGSITEYDLCKREVFFIAILRIR